ncbi:hypothetical protein [Kibdelosporangium phytohabitans]|uniref:DUF3558 domain-containing protein n=1 Tax=Kibdelosporangium phytohabitans TaxID=860235 RepID=A0A0N9HT51_9PSEU|nr:hypothetical protein [Kibdelosporangium phytohabitans]ALG06395.1 hypothetical protein AOZ06_05170 [Kibdelosporangium phytohabitans]MBE1467546.1 hypothetical protein [Kibdelosporangium phytohabitans]
MAVQENLTKADSPKSLPTLETTGTTCELAAKAAESVLRAIPPNHDTRPNDKDGQTRRAGRNTPIVLGDLDRPPTWKDVGAPYDPCGIPWTDFAQEVRPTDGKPHAPRLKRPDADVKWQIECVYDNSGPITVAPKAGTSSNPEGGYFLATVVWQRDGTADPAKNQGSQAKTWAGRSGYLKPAPDDPRLGQGCMAAVRLTAGGNPAGATAIFISNSRFPQKQACDVADQLAGAIATKTQ